MAPAPSPEVVSAPGRLLDLPDALHGSANGGKIQCAAIREEARLPSRLPLVLVVVEALEVEQVVAVAP